VTLALALEVAVGDPPELGIDRGVQLVGGSGVGTAELEQEVGDLSRLGHRPTSEDAGGMRCHEPTA
jgi:hypothetical protein